MSISICRVVTVTKTGNRTSLAVSTCHAGSSEQHPRSGWMALTVTISMDIRERSASNGIAVNIENGFVVLTSIITNMLVLS